jgi:nitrite reductase (NO-forming)
MFPSLASIPEVAMRPTVRNLVLLLAPALVVGACSPTYVVPETQAAAATGGAPQHVEAAWDPDRAPSDGWEPRDPRLEPAPEGDLHELTIRTSEVEKEVAPGVTQQVWTYDELFPGPVLRGKVGDTFRITLINDGQLGHSIDFHSSKVAPNVEMRTIERGEELIYEFEAKHAGVFMYHCGTKPVLQHTGMGQHGIMIVDPPDLPEVDHEFWMLQHETYMGNLPDAYAKMETENWDAVVFNGYPNQYVHHPIEGVKPGERVRMWVGNNGPSERSSFHVIGTIFDTVFKEGSYRLHPDRDAPGGAQVIDLLPSTGGFVEFTFDTDGIYPFVDHKFANVPKGAVGLFVVGDVDPSAGGK